MDPSARPAAPHLAAGELEPPSDPILADDTMWRFAPCMRHGDLVPEHVLVTPSGDLSAVLDREEVGVGDPALDLAWWLHAMPSIGARVLAA